MSLTYYLIMRNDYALAVTGLMLKREDKKLSP